MAEESGNIPQAVGLVAVNGIVIFGKRSFEKISPHAVDLCEPFTDETVKLRVGFLLRATLHDHGWKLLFLSSWKVDLHEFVAALFEINTGHNGQIDSPPQVDQIGVGLVLDVHLALFFIFRLLFRADIGVVFFFVVASLAKNLSFQFLIRLFMFFPLRIILENIQTVLHLDFIVKTGTMRDLIVLFHQIQLILDRRVILVPVLSHLEQDLNHVLDALIDISLVKDVSELVEDSQRNRCTHFLQMLTHFSCQSHSDLDAIIGRFVKEEQENLGGKHFVRNLLIAEMRNEGRRGDADCFIVSFESLAELHDKSLEQQFTNLWQLGIDDCRHSSVDGCKGQTRSLRFHDASTEKTSSSNQVFAKKFWHDVFDVRHVDLVDQPVD